MTLNWLFQYVSMKQVQSNNGVPALTLNYQEKKQRIKIYETCHFIFVPKNFQIGVLWG